MQLMQDTFVDKSIRFREQFTPFTNAVEDMLLAARTVV